MRRCAIAALLVIAAAVPTAARAEPDESGPEEKWSLDFAFQHYFLPHEDDLSVPVLSLYYENILFEARYNYEDRRAGSFWLGRPFSFGESWQFELTPMAGVVVGSQHAAAPGLKLDVNWKSLNIYSEMEYVVDFDTRDNNFFYSWSEVTVGLWEHLRVGIVGSRTRAYDSPVDLDRGPVVRLEFEEFTLSFTALDLEHDAILIAGIEMPLGKRLRHAHF
jgi:hypothetical protein